MLSYQIDSILRKNPHTQKYYEGCFAADQIPTKFHSYPKCMVVNTDDSDEPGEHWVAIFITSPRHVEFYDSLGESRIRSEKIAKFINQFPNIKNNIGKFVQSPFSASCGEHAIYFLHMRCKGYGFDSIIRKLFNSKTKADKLVKNFIMRKKEMYN
jgi:hypothetical protein